MTDYYVDFTNGSDSYNGLYGTYTSGSDGPWKTLSYVCNVPSFSGNDNIYLKRGEVWQYSNADPDVFEANESGSSGNPITWSAYGSGANPIIRSWAEHEGWDTTGNWTDYGGTVTDTYYMNDSVSNRLNPYRLWIDGVEYPVAATAGDVDSTYRWYYGDIASGNRLLVYSPDGNPATYFTSLECANGDGVSSGGSIYGARVYGASYVNIEYIDFEGGIYGLEVTNNGATLSEYVDISNCNIGKNSVSRGVHINHSGAYTNTNIDVHDCVVDGNYSCWVADGNAPPNGGDGIMIKGGNYCEVYDNVIQGWWHAGFGMDGTGTDDSARYNKFYRNQILGDGYTYMRGFAWDGTSTTNCADNEVYSNYVYNTTIRNQTNGYNNKVYNNVIDTITSPSGGYPTSESGQGFSLAPSGGNLSQNNEFYGNVIKNTSGAGIRLTTFSGMGTLSGNDFHDNVIIETGGNESNYGIVLVEYNSVSMPAQTFNRNRMYDSGTSDTVYYLTDGDGGAMTPTEFNAKNGTDGITIANNATLSGATLELYSGESVPYFVDDSGGSNSNAGIVEDYPWQTLSNVNTQIAPCTAKVMLKSRGVWREQLTVPNDDITFGSYNGVLPKPVISGCNILTNASFSATTDTQSTYVSDTFNRGDQSGWGTADGGTDTDKSWSIVYGSGEISSNQARSDTTWTSARGIVGDDNTNTRNLYAEFSGVFNDSDARAVSILPRYEGANERLAVTYSRYSETLKVYKNSHIDPWTNQLASESVTDPGASFKMRVLVYNVDRDVVVKARVWTGTEPSTWNLTYTDEWTERNADIPTITSGQFGVEVVNAGTTTCYVDNFECKSGVSSYSSTYEYSLTTDPGSFVMEDGVALAKMVDISGVECNPGSFYWASNVLYVHASDSSSPITNGKVYEAPYRALVVNPNAKNNISYQNIKFTGATGQTLFQASSDTVSLYRCDGEHLVYEGLPMGDMNRRNDLKIGFHQDLNYMGVSTHQQRVEQIAAIGAQISRHSLPWKVIEASQGTKDWSRPDSVVKLCEIYGIEPIFVLVGSPQWANGDSDEFVIPSGGSFTTWVTNYTTWATAAATRYKGRVRKWELWNEPNDEYFWKPTPSSSNYITWADSVYDAVKAVDSNNEVVIGGLTSMNAGGANCLEAVTEFLPAMYDGTFYADGVAIHPYPSGNNDSYYYAAYNNAFTDISDIRNVMESYSRTSDLLWLTEHGWTTASVSEANQSLYLCQSLEILRENYPYVSVCTIFWDRDDATYEYGVYTDAPAKKKSARTFQEWQSLRGHYQSAQGNIVKSLTIALE